MATKQYISYSARGGSGGGVSSLNTLTGAVVLAAGSGITITPAGNTLTIAATLAGAVTAVTASSPLFSSGGSTPNLTIQLAGAGQDGYLSSTDWNTFNNKQPALGFTPENSANKGIAGGYASLDGAGKVPVSQLPSALMTYLGNWDASTNTPTLADGTGDVGDVYRVSVAGTQNLGSGPITFFVGDFVIYNGTIWQRSPAADGVTSVNGFTGAVVLTTTDINEGTNLYFTNERAQDAVGSILVDTSSVSFLYDDPANDIRANVNLDPVGPLNDNGNGLSINVSNGIDITTGGVDAQTSLLLHFDNNLVDSSSYGNTVVQDGATGDTYQPGEFGQALDFTVANTGFSVANFAGIQFGSGDFTVECWLKPTISGDSTNHQFLNKSNGTTTDWFFLYFSDQLRFGIPNLAFQTAAVPVSIEDGNWHHVAFVRSGTNTYMFLDGSVIDSSSVSGSISNTSGADLGIGHYLTNFSEQYDGLMDEVRISKGIARWTANFTPPSQPYTDSLNSIELAPIANNTVLANKSGITAPPTANTLSDVVESVSNILTITNGSKAVVSASNLSIEVKQSGAAQDGYLSSTDWNTFNGKQAAGNYITALTGDATASGPGSVAITLATVNGDVGSFGSSTAIPSFTVNAKGLITAASTNVVIAPAGTLTGTTLAANVVSSSLTSVGTIATGVWNGTTIGITNGGTGQTTTSAAFNALSPMTTLGDIIYGGASGTGTRLAVGASNEVLTVSGGIPSWQPAAASPASKGIYQGHMVDSSTDYWSRGNTALGDMTTNGTPVLVQDYNSGMGTVTIASGDGPGIALTAPFTGTIEVTCVLFSQVPAGTMTVQLVEAGGTVLNGSRNLVSASMTLVGVFDVTASSSYTFKLQTAITTGTGYVGGVGTPGYSLGFSVKYIK